MKPQLSTEVYISGVMIGREGLNFMEKGLSLCHYVSGADPFLRGSVAAWVFKKFPIFYRT